MAIRDDIARFCRQYLQLERHLDYPPATSLRDDQVQATLYEQLFADGAVAFPPSHRYQLGVLKELMAATEASIDDWDQHGVSDDLMGSLSSLLSLPMPSEITAAQQKSYVTYTLSLLDQVSSSAVQPAARITLLEHRNLISAFGTTGLRTWEAALHLGQYLCSHRSLIQGQRVIELGAGTGYLSILCAKYLGASQVIASDGSDDVVANLPENFYLNGLEGATCISAMDIKWGHALVGTEEQYWNGAKPIDVVLGADVTYDKTVIPALIGTMEELVGMFPEVKVLLAATERNRETFESFLGVCYQRQFRVDEVDFRLPAKKEQSGPFYSDDVPIRICTIHKS
ncbi:Uu.00g095660.m01.CDS01 [Anthostomella pinea]|uniref:Uu.00g095660.m01.CDS01 n=1 Tax=Anthostomella pinea TaxID=933095 RepID=A0AAI8YEW0_9PEZI|nr:Uu.00g095660.m01.CDS01 [Anthostomella pinea]